MFTDKDSLESIFTTLSIAEDPNILVKGIAEQLKLDKIDKKLIDKYKRMTTEIMWAKEKISKYPIFFEKFYPKDENSEIKLDEALEHHIHGYLEDITILKNRLLTFIGSLKNDLKEHASNKKEINDALKTFINNINEVFEQVNTHRHPHAHQGDRFLDSDLVNVKMADVILSREDSFKDQFKPEFLQELEDKKLESFGKSKEKWISLSKSNQKEISGLTEHIMSLVKSPLYQLLNIENLENDLEKIEKVQSEGKNKNS